MSKHFATQAFTHGTLECRELEASKRFYKEFLGLHCVRMSPRVNYLWLGGEWLIACIQAGELKEPQGPENRFALRVSSIDEVRQAREAVLAQSEKWGLGQCGSLNGDDNTLSFTFEDLDGNWWEIYCRSDRGYDDLFGSGALSTAELQRI